MRSLRRQASIYRRSLLRTYRQSGTSEGGLSQFTFTLLSSLFSLSERSHWWRGTHLTVSEAADGPILMHVTSFPIFRILIISAQPNQTMVMMASKRKAQHATLSQNESPDIYHAQIDASTAKSEQDTDIWDEDEKASRPCGSEELVAKKIKVSASCVVPEMNKVVEIPSGISVSL